MKMNEFEVKNDTLIKYHGDDEDVVIPISVETETGLQFITRIGYAVFADKNLKRIRIPCSVRTIDNYAFAHCGSLERIELGDDVISIGQGAFFYCTSLKEVKLGEGLCRIDREAFMGCESLPCITIPWSVEYIGEMAVGYIRRRSLTLYDGFVIRGRKGSIAEDYAMLNRIKFREV